MEPAARSLSVNCRTVSVNNHQSSQAFPIIFGMSRVVKHPTHVSFIPLPRNSKRKVTGSGTKKTPLSTNTKTRVTVWTKEIHGTLPLKVTKQQNAHGSNSTGRDVIDPGRTMKNHLPRHLSSSQALNLRNS